MLNTKCLLTIFFLGLVPFWALGQQNKFKTKTRAYEDVVYNKEFSIGLKAHTNGFGLSANFVKIKSITNKRVYEIEIMNLKHPKEFRQQSLFASGRNSARGFVYGKRNSFYNINASLGWIKALAEKGRKSGVEVSLYYAFGPSLGILKPYYLELIYGASGTFLVTQKEKYTSENASLFLNDDLIYGSAGFINGLTEIGLRPGAQAKTALHFDWANYNEFVKAIEVGAMANVYAGRVPIMVDETEDNKFFFLNFYLRLILGKRW